MKQPYRHPNHQRNEPYPVPLCDCDHADPSNATSTHSPLYDAVLKFHLPSSSGPSSPPVQTPTASRACSGSTATELHEHQRHCTSYSCLTACWSPTGLAVLASPHGVVACLLGAGCLGLRCHCRSSLLPGRWHVRRRGRTWKTCDACVSVAPRVRHWAREPSPPCRPAAARVHARRWLLGIVAG